MCVVQGEPGLKKHVSGEHVDDGQGLVQLVSDGQGQWQLRGHVVHGRHAVNQEVEQLVTENMHMRALISPQ